MVNILDVYKALADPTRREILQRLKSGSKNAGELAEGIEMSKPAITKHLNVLKDANLVLSEREGQMMIYSLRASVLEETLLSLMSLMAPKSSGKGE